MRILHIIDSLSPHLGGPPAAVSLLAQAYMEIGAQIEVVCLDNPEAEFLKRVPCKVHALNQSYLGQFSLSPKLYRWLIDNIRHYDGVVMNGIWSFPGVALCRVARRFNVPYGVFVHGALDPWFNEKYPLKHLKKLLYWRIQYKVLHEATAVFFTTDTECVLARKSFEPNVWREKVVSYGIIDPEGRYSEPKKQTDEFYEKFPALVGRKYFIFLGRIHEKKGCDLLLEAYAEIAKEFPDYDLVMAGPDDSKYASKLKAQALELQLDSRVFWAGMITGDLKWGALRCSEAFVLPSHQENFGIAVVESLAVGRPVLISNQVNIWPEIEQEGVGLVEPDTTSGTVSLMRRWIKASERERKEMADKTRPCFQRRFSMARAASAINEIFEQRCNELIAAKQLKVL